MRVFILLASLYMTSISASALASNDIMTAGDLQQICLGADSESKAACRLFIFGVEQGIGIGMGIADGKTKSGRPCVPKNISSSSIELAVKKKMGEDLMVYPEDRKLSASGLVGAIIVNTFPCGSSQK